MRKNGIVMLWHFGDAILQLDPGRADVLFNKGVTLWQLNQSREEIAVYEEVIRRYGDATEPGIREPVAKAMFNKGVVLYQLKQYDEARKAFEAAEKRGEPAARRALEILKAEGH